MRGQDHRWIWLFLLLGMLLGLWLIFYPRINTEIYAWQANQTLEKLETQTEQAQAHLPVDQEQIYQALFDAMLAYNENLAQERQTGLTGPGVYERSPLKLEDYGLEAGSPVGSLRIPAIDLTLPLYLGANRENIALGAAVLGETSLPIGGMDTNCVIAGHRGYRGIPYFRYLDRLEPGDLIYLSNFWETLVYQVTNSVIIQPDDLDAILISYGKDQLTLLTCHPYGVGTQRLLVYAERMVL